MLFNSYQLTYINKRNHHVMYEETCTWLGLQMSMAMSPFAGGAQIKCVYQKVRVGVIAKIVIWGKKLCLK